MLRRTIVRGVRGRSWRRGLCTKESPKETPKEVVKETPNEPIKKADMNMGDRALEFVLENPVVVVMSLILSLVGYVGYGAIENMQREKIEAELDATNIIAPSEYKIMRQNSRVTPAKFLFAVDACRAVFPTGVAPPKAFFWTFEAALGLAADLIEGRDREMESVMRSMRGTGGLSWFGKAGEEKKEDVEKLDEWELRFDPFLDVGKLSDAKSERLVGRHHFLRWFRALEEGRGEEGVVASGTKGDEKVYDALWSKPEEGKKVLELPLRTLMVAMIAFVPGTSEERADLLMSVYCRMVEGRAPEVGEKIGEGWGKEDGAMGDDGPSDYFLVQASRRYKKQGRPEAKLDEDAAVDGGLSEVVSDVRPPMTPRFIRRETLVRLIEDLRFTRQLSPMSAATAVKHGPSASDVEALRPKRRKPVDKSVMEHVSDAIFPKFRERTALDRIAAAEGKIGILPVPAQGAKLLPNEFTPGTGGVLQASHRRRVKKGLGLAPPETKDLDLVYSRSDSFRILWSDPVCLWEECPALNRTLQDIY